MFSFLKWLSVIRAPGGDGDLHSSDGLRMWERGSHVNPGGIKNRWNANKLCTIISSHWALIPNPAVLVLPAWGLRGRDHGSRCLWARINYNCIIGGRWECWPFVLAIVNVRDEEGRGSPPRPSSGLTPGRSETDLCETRIPEIHSENEWDTENQGPGVLDWLWRIVVW